jgi:hypothetical protein
MSASEAFTEPSLFDHTSREPANKPTSPTVDERPARTANPAAAKPANTANTASTAGSPTSRATEVAEVREPEAASDNAESEEVSAADAEPSTETPEVALTPEAIAQNERKRLAEQLHALKRKEFEIRRALAATDHPDLAEAIRTLEGRAFTVSRAEAKLAQGFSKSEARRREVIDKKLGTLRAKREELDTQITALETELGGLGADRLSTFESERQTALEQLMIAMAQHANEFRAANLEPSSLVPEIEGWLPELEAIAKKLSA